MTNIGGLKKKNFRHLILTIRLNLIVNNFKSKLLFVAIVLVSGLIPAIVCQFFTGEPVSRDIHMRSFRYGKDPSVIRVNRGDTLNMKFSTDDTGHSFFLEEFDIDAKVSPAREMVEVFGAADPTKKSYLTSELTFITKHKGIRNYLVSKSNYRCHVWCGPMHAFELGKLIIMPNTLLFFSLGCLIGLVSFWIAGFFRTSGARAVPASARKGYRDVLSENGIVHKLVSSRWPQLILTLVAMLMIYIVILTSLFGTKMSGRNLGVLLMWAIWLFLLVAILTPLLGRSWCTICPLPFFGDLIQRRSFFTPELGKTNGFFNRFHGLSLKWPELLRNSWLKLFVFLILATFSTTLVANPRVSGLAVIFLILTPTLMAMVWELRAFCRYVCPVSVFLGPFARMGSLGLRNKSQELCDDCRALYCMKGNNRGWACPYGLNVRDINENSDCGLCLECVRSCSYNNVTLYRRPFASELGTRNLSEAWGLIAVFTLSIVYSILYEGHWPVVRDFVNILDKKNWDLFGIYTLIVWTLALVIFPGIIYLTAAAGKKLSGVTESTRNVFFKVTGSLLPLGLALWIAFVIPMLFVNVTFILQSFSDPFGWGWDFFGTANIPWHQFVPGLVPWLQAGLIITGLALSLRNLGRTFRNGSTGDPKKLFLLILPAAIFLITAATALLFFYTN